MIETIRFLPSQDKIVRSLDYSFEDFLPKKVFILQEKRQFYFSGMACCIFSMTTISIKAIGPSFALMIILYAMLRVDFCVHVSVTGSHNSD